MNSLLRQLQDRFPTRAKWLIAPTHGVGRMITDRLALDGGSWTNIRSITPLDIALRMGAPFLVERGIDPSKEALGPALIMRLLLGMLGGDTYFKPLGSHPAMAQALWSTIRELRLAAIGPDDLKANAFGSPAKHRELQELYRAYETFLASNKRGDLASVYAEALKHLDWCPVRAEDCWLELPDVAWSPMQRRLLDALPGERIVPRAVELVSAVIPRRLRDAKVEWSRHDAAPLSFMLAPQRLPKAHAGAVELFHAGGREAEIEEVFRRILASRRPLDEIEIAAASEEYVPLIWEKACRHEWPVSILLGLPASLTRPGRALVALSNWAESDFAAGVLRRFLQSGDASLGDFDVAPGSAARVLVKASAAWGRKTYGLAIGRLIKGYRMRASDADFPDEQRAAAEKKAAQAEQVLQWINSLLDAIPEPDERQQIDLQSLVDGVVQFIEKSTARGNALDGAAAIALAAAVKELKALGSFRCSLAEGFRFVRERVDGVKIGSDRARPGYLFVSTLAQAGYSGRRQLFVVGLKEGRVFPAPTEDPVLLDAERAAISSLLRLSTDRSEEAVYTALSRLAAASLNGDVCLSYSCRDLREYRQTYPSWLMLQAFRIATGNSNASYPDLMNALATPASCVPTEDRSALSRKDWWLYAAKSSGSDAVAPISEQHSALLAGMEAARKRQSEQFTEYDGYVPEAGAVLDPCVREHPLSATQLEAAAECPFRHFLERGLHLSAVDDGARDTDVWLTPLTRGSLLHALYAKTMRRGRELKRRLTLKDDLDWCHASARAELEILCAEMPPASAEIFEREERELLEDLKLFLRAEEEAEETRTPLGFEVAFGRPAADEGEPLACADPIIVDLGGGLKFKLAGQIDRIDQIADGAIEVIDYKTGGYFQDDYKGVFSKGRKLQHALYGLAAVEILKRQKKKAAVKQGVYYFSSARGGQHRRAMGTVSSAQLRSVLGDLREVIASGLFIHGEDEGACKFCDFGAACGTDAKDLAAPKIENATELDAYRRLGSHD